MCVCVTAYVLGVTGADSPERSWSRPVWPRRNAETTKDHCCCCRCGGDDDFSSSQTQLVQPERDKHVVAQQMQKGKLGQPPGRPSRRNRASRSRGNAQTKGARGQRHFERLRLNLLLSEIFFSLDDRCNAATPSSINYHFRN